MLPVPRPRTLLLVGISLAICGVFAGASPSEDPPARPDPQALLGTWKVDLRPKPGEPDYFKEFVVKEVTGKTFKGTFYDTEFENGHINADWDTVYFAFTTGDKSGLYAHSGAIRNGRLEGLSHAVGREFLSVWKAERKP